MAKPADTQTVENPATNPAAEIDIYEVMSTLALPRAERDAVVSFDELVTADTIAELPSPYRVVKNKDEYVEKPFYIREVKFRDELDSDYSRPYCILYCVSPEEMFILTDGGTGIYNTMVALVERRVAEGRADAVTGFFFPNGLRKSEYDIDADGKAIDRRDKDAKKAGKGATYYFA